MKARNMRWTGVLNITLLLALAAVSLPDARSFAIIPPDQTPGEVGMEIKLPNDPTGRNHGLVDPGNGGGRAGGSRDAANPDDFSVNSPGIHQPDIKVAVVQDTGLSRLMVRVRQLLARILDPAR